VELLKIKALEMGLAWVIGPLAMLTMQGMKAASRGIDALPAWQQRVVVVAVAAVLTLLGQVLGVDFGVTTDSLEGLKAIELETLKVAIASALAMGLHALKKTVGKRR
jgi:hypothetical protein